MAELDYEQLWRLAEEKARVSAAQMWPVGEQREKEELRLTVKYYREMVTPPPYANPIP